MIKIGDTITWSDSELKFHITDFRCRGIINPHHNSWKIEWTCPTTGKKCVMWEAEGSIQQGLREGYIKIISPQLIREVISKHRFN
jgi:hypothetical protein